MPKVCPVCGASYADSSVFCPADGTTLRAADAGGDLIGSVVADRYLITDLLGEGGMGSVFLARHVRLPQQAAIKVLKREMVRDPAAVARFNREASNASRIDNDRVARVYDFGETDDGTVYLAMEFVAGRTLKQLLAALGPLPPSRATDLVRQIAEGLDAAHRLGIVHRDLKPDNVLVVEDDELGDRVKVVDFGIAKAIGGGGDGEPGLTKTGFIIGTPEFMSPEQLLGGEIDLRSDVYALALVAYQLLTGVLPFGGDTPEATMTARLVHPPKPLRESLSALAWPAAVQAVFDAALSREPDERPASAGAFARALRAAIDAWLTPASARRAIDPAAPPPARRPDASAAADAAAGAVASAPAGSATAALGGIGGRAGDPAGAPAASVATTARAAGTRDAGAGAPAAPPTGGEGRRGLLVGAVATVAAAAVIATLVLGGDDPAASAGVPPDDTIPAPTIVTPPTTSVPTTTSADSTATADGPSAEAPVAAAPASDRTGRDGEAVTGSAQTGSANTAGAAAGGRRTAAATTTPAAGVTSRPPADGGVERPAAPATSTTSAAARRTLDSLERALNPATADAATARASIGALRTLLGRLGTAEDSAWAYIRMAEAHLLLDDARSACLDLVAAAPLARAAEQRNVLNRLRGFASC